MKHIKWTDEELQILRDNYVTIGAAGIANLIPHSRSVIKNKAKTLNLSCDNKFIDLTGKRFGNLTVLGIHPRDRCVVWDCQCDCGTHPIVKSQYLLRGSVKSCGCKHYEVKDRIGQRYGRLTVIEFAGTKKKQSYWLCRCDCGTEKVIGSSPLESGHTVSCGCKSREGSEAIHGGAKTRLYNIWVGMKQRCGNPKSEVYIYYGDRGIKICKDWNGFVAFRTWALSNGYADNLTIDRINVNGNYEPSNCRWATMKEQGRNRRNNRFITIGQKTFCVAEWAKIYGVNPSLIHHRIKEGWDEIEAVTTPLIKRGYIHNKNPQYKT
jgi:hypothetical protein